MTPCPFCATPVAPTPPDGLCPSCRAALLFDAEGRIRWAATAAAIARLAEVRR